MFIPTGESRFEVSATAWRVQSVSALCRPWFAQNFVSVIIYTASDT